jgi:hypothetical protein
MPLSFNTNIKNHATADASKGYAWKMSCWTWHLSGFSDVRASFRPVIRM